MDDRFLIGDFPFCLTAPEDLPVPDNFLKFRADVSPAYAYRLGWANALPALDGPVLAQRTALTVCGTPEQEQRGLLLAGAPLAVYRETAPDAADVAVLRAQGSMLCVDTVFVSLLALERRMLARDGLIEADFTVDIDLDSQRAWLESQGTPTVDLSDQQVRQANTGTQVFLVLDVKPIDAMEDVRVTIRV